MYTVPTKGRQAAVKHDNDAIIGLLLIANTLLLFAILIRQEIIAMSTNSQLTDLDNQLTQVEADETSVAADLAIIIADFKTAQQNNQPIDLNAEISRLSALHTKLSGDDATLVAAEPATPAV